MNMAEVFMGKKGARLIGKLGELSLVKLNSKSGLGEKGEILCLIQDQVIFRSVIMQGTWEAKTAHFLANELLSHPDSLLLDLGANQGLMTKQILNLVPYSISSILVEPISEHILASRLNLHILASFHKIVFVEAALDLDSGIGSIYSDQINHGHTTFYKSLIPEGRSLSRKVSTISVKEFENKFLNSIEKIVLKSDMQGFDLTFLSSISVINWQKVIAAAVEVWAISEIDDEVIEKLRVRLSQFTSLQWEIDKVLITTTVDNVLEYWGSNDGTWRDLYLKS
jgi:FkbM family methyltransferase